VLSVCRANANRADIRLVADLDAADVGESPSTQDRGAAGRDDHRHAPSERGERPRVEMVVVEVGDERGVDRLQCTNVRLGHGSPKVNHAAPQNGIGDQADTVELDQNGAMPEPRDA
jgi:hypothetical protein